MKELFPEKYAPQRVDPELGNHPLGPEMNFGSHVSGIYLDSHVDEDDEA